MRSETLDLSQLREVAGCDLDGDASHVFELRERGVCAIQWTGDNRTQVEKFLRDHGVSESGLEPNASSVVGFWAWGNYHQIMHNWWIVIPRHGFDADGNGRVLTDTEFRDAYAPWKPMRAG